jgi:hypothetical protein
MQSQSALAHSDMSGIFKTLAKLYIFYELAKETGKKIPK